MEDVKRKVYTTNTGARALGVKQDTMKHYAHKFGVGSQPGGPGTTWLFTHDDLMLIRRRTQKWEKVEREEDRESLGLGPLYNADATPRE